MMVWLNACPMCSVPVTLGGGSWMAKFSPLAAASALGWPVPRTPAAPRPAASHAGPQRASMAAGSNDLGRLSSMGWAVGLWADMMKEGIERKFFEGKGAHIHTQNLGVERKRRTNHFITGRAFAAAQEAISERRCGLRRFLCLIGAQRVRMRHRYVGPICRSNRMLQEWVLISSSPTTSENASPSSC